MTDTLPATTATPEASATPDEATASPAKPDRPLGYYGSKRDTYMRNSDRFRESIPHQYAAQTYAIADHAEATREQTDVLAAQNRILARIGQGAEKANEQAAQIAAKQLAIAERQAEIAERHAAAAERAAEAAERQAEATAALAREQRLSTLLAYYTTPQEAWIEASGHAIMRSQLTGQPATEG